MKIKYLLYPIPFFFMTNSHGYDVRINVSGTVADQTCNVVAADKTKNVDFGDLEAKQFKSKGDTSISKSLSVNLEDCTSSMTSLKYQFSGEADSTDSNLLAINTSNTPATGLAIQILDKDSDKQINLNQLYKASDYIKGNSKQIFNFALRYKSTSSSVTAGDASSILFLDFYYE